MATERMAAERMAAERMATGQLAAERKAAELKAAEQVVREWFGSIPVMVKSMYCRLRNMSDAERTAVMPAASRAPAAGRFSSAHAAPIQPPVLHGLPWGAHSRPESISFPICTIRGGVPCATKAATVFSV